MTRFSIWTLFGLFFSSLLLANNTLHDLSTTDFSQDWSDAALITANDDWSLVSSIVGFRGDNLGGAGTATDPQTLLVANDPGAIDVNANQANPTTFTTGGVAEFDGIVNPVVALQGSGTADAPYIQIYLNSTGRQNIQVSYNLRDIDDQTNNDAFQQLALHYRTSNTGDWTNVPAAYVADATVDGTNQVTPISVSLPANANDQAILQLRVMTSNAAGSDEWIGIDDISVSSLELLAASAVVNNNVSTFGGSDGQATATPSGGETPYAYVWSNAATTASISNLSAGTYTVTVTDDNGQGVSDTASVTITQPGPATVASAVVDNNVTVNGGSDGAATASGSGGQTPYTYLWSNAATTASITGLTAGTYTVTVTGGGGQGTFDTASVTITEPTAVVATAVVDNNVTTNGGFDGQVSASATGGVGNYEYLWSNGANTSVNGGLSAGTYTVTVTDDNGAFDTDMVTVTEPPPALIAAAVVDSNVSVNGGSDGAATASATGGVAPYAYAWSNGDTTASITNLTAGTYTVTVTDSNGNGDTDTASVTITEPAAALVASAVVDNNVSVNGGSDGAATASATGGVAPYTYAWSNGDTTASIINLTAGTYTVTVTDSNGNGDTDTASVTITEPGAVIASAVVDNNVSTNGGSDGQVSASATGGVAPYSYLWSNGANTAVNSGLSAGTYTVTVTDDNGATDTDMATVTEPAPAALVASAVVDNNVSVNGGSDGAATASATGGVAPYVYAWSNGAITASITNLPAGTYTVTVTGDNGSGDSDTASVTITEPAEVLASISNVTNESSPGAADGSATVTASGGTAPYYYLWSNGATTATINNLTAGNYTVTVTDDSGATSDQATAVVGVAGVGSVQAVPVNSAWMLSLLIIIMLSMSFIHTRKH